MIYKDERELFASGIVTVEESKVKISDLEAFRQNVVDNLIDTLILSNSIQLKKICYWIVYEAAYLYGITLCLKI